MSVINRNATWSALLLLGVTQLILNWSINSLQSMILSIVCNCWFNRQFIIQLTIDDQIRDWWFNRKLIIWSGIPCKQERYLCLGRLMESSGVLPTTQFAYWKGPGTCDALLCMSHTVQSALESGQEARVVQIDFSAAIDRVNNQRIMYKLCSAGIGGSVLCILIQFLSNRSKHIMVGSCRSKLVKGVVPEVIRFLSCFFYCV